MKKQRAMTWTTRADPTYTAQFGVPEIHYVLFEPNNDRGGARNVVSIMIPETPPHDIATAMTQARKLQARVAFVCDTAKQAHKIAKQAAPRLPQHHRIALERAEHGCWGNLV